MDFILSAISFVFIGLIVAAALTVGLSLLVWFSLMGMVIFIYFLCRQYYLRWKFLRQHREDVIEGVYIDVSDRNNQP